MAKPRAMTINGRGAKPATIRTKTLPGRFYKGCQALKPLAEFKRYPLNRGVRMLHRTCKACEKRFKRLNPLAVAIRSHG